MAMEAGGDKQANDCDIELNQLAEEELKEMLGMTKIPADGDFLPQSLWLLMDASRKDRVTEEWRRIMAEPEAQARAEAEAEAEAEAQAQARADAESEEEAEEERATDGDGDGDGDDEKGRKLHDKLRQLAKAELKKLNVTGSEDPIFDEVDLRQRELLKFMCMTSASSSPKEFLMNFARFVEEAEARARARNERARDDEKARNVERNRVTTQRVPLARKSSPVLQDKSKYKAIVLNYCKGNKIAAPTERSTLDVFGKHAVDVHLKNKARVTLSGSDLSQTMYEAYRMLLYQLLPKAEADHRILHPPMDLSDGEGDGDANANANANYKSYVLAYARDEKKEEHPPVERFSSGHRTPSMNISWKLVVEFDGLRVSAEGRSKKQASKACYKELWEKIQRRAVNR